MMKYLRASKQAERQRAFTLIETVVSVTILAIAVVGPMTLASRSIRASTEVRLKLTATYLAQEGVEVIRNIRDNNSADDPVENGDRADWLNLNGANTLLTNCLVDSLNLGCVPDITSTASSDAWNSTNIARAAGSLDRRRVYRHPTTGIFRQRGNGPLSGYVDTGFSRYISVSLVSPTQVHVVSTVTYNSKGSTRTVIAEDDIYNWFPDLDPPPP